MITLTYKQQIILKHIDDVSNREIVRILHISKDTVSKNDRTIGCGIRNVGFPIRSI